MRGIAICWPENSKRIAGLASGVRIPFHCRPLHATVPGGRVALVAPNGDIQLMCIVARLDGPKSVHVATGEFRDNGYQLVAKKAQSVQRERTILAACCFGEEPWVSRAISINGGFVR